MDKRIQHSSYLEAAVAANFRCDELDSTVEKSHPLSLVKKKGLMHEPSLEVLMRKFTIRSCSLCCAYLAAHKDDRHRKFNYNHVKLSQTRWMEEQRVHPS